jgi:hypothetical protein
MSDISTMAEVQNAIINGNYTFTGDEAHALENLTEGVTTVAVLRGSNDKPSFQTGTKNLYSIIATELAGNGDNLKGFILRNEAPDGSKLIVEFVFSGELEGLDESVLRSFMEEAIEAMASEQTPELLTYVMETFFARPEGCRVGVIEHPVLRSSYFIVCRHAIGTTCGLI